MVSSLAFAVVLSASAGSFVSPQGTDGVQLLRDACVATNLQRDVFERLGRERRWRSQRMTRRSGEQGWVVAFRTDNALVMLIGGSPRDGDESGRGANCSVSIEQAGAGIETDLGELAQTLDLEDEGLLVEGPPGFVPPRVWSRLGGQTLTYAAAADGRAVISFSRQIVSSETAPVSPPGN